MYYSSYSVPSVFQCFFGSSQVVQLARLGYRPATQQPKLQHLLPDGTRFRIGNDPRFLPPSSFIKIVIRILIWLHVLCWHNNQRERPRCACRLARRQPLMSAFSWRVPPPLPLSVQVTTSAPTISFPYPEDKIKPIPSQSTTVTAAEPFLAHPFAVRYYRLVL